MKLFVCQVTQIFANAKIVLVNDRQQDLIANLQLRDVKNTSFSAA